MGVAAGLDPGDQVGQEAVEGGEWRAAGGRAGAMTTSLQPDNTEQHGDLAGLRTASATRLQSAERDAGTSLLVQMLGLEIVLTELAAARIEIGRRAGDIATAGRTLQQIAAAVTGRIETVIAKAEGRQRMLEQRQQVGKPA